MAIVTVLAFVYVPLNLATSIFGMNIYQLNRSGQNLSAFIATALTALAVTGGVWYLLEQANSYRKWREGHLRKKFLEPTKFKLMTRINMLIWLSLSQHRYHMIRRGFWWRLLTNNKSRMCYMDADLRQIPGWTAAEFVSHHSRNACREDTSSTMESNDWVWKSVPPPKKDARILDTQSQPWQFFL